MGGGGRGKVLNNFRELGRSCITFREFEEHSQNNFREHWEIS